MLLRVPPAHPAEDEAWKSWFRASDHTREELIGTHKMCKEAINELEMEEERLRNQMQEIVNRKTTLVSRVCKLESALAPYKKLPPEVLSQIFELTRGDSLHLPPKDPGMIKFNPIRIQHEFRPQHVCSLWRQVALQIPAIRDGVWKEVHVNYTRLWEQSDYSTDQQFTDAISELAKFAKRIISRGTRTLEVDFGDWNNISDDDIQVADDSVFRMIISEGLSELEELTIKNEDATQQFMEACMDLLPTFPQLESVHLKLTPCDEDFLPLPESPLHNLIKLTIQSPPISAGGFYHLLTCSPQLQSCSVMIEDEEHYPLASQRYTRTITHQTLNTLCLTYYEHEPLPCGNMAPLHTLNLPSLRRLEFWTDQRLSGCGLQLFSDFVRRSRCHLEKLHLGYGGLDDLTLERSDFIATYLSNVEDLKVPWIFSSDILQRIANGEHLPNVITLHCAVAEMNEYGEGIRQLMESRRTESGEEPTGNYASFQLIAGSSSQ